VFYLTSDAACGQRRSWASAALLIVNRFATMRMLK
jgi:hypothetical protein